MGSTKIVQLFTGFSEIKKIIFFFAKLKKRNTFAVAKLKTRPVRLGVRTPDFHSGNRGSIPLRATILTKIIFTI